MTALFVPLEVIERDPPPRVSEPDAYPEDPVAAFEA
jgi:hypothetical protein